jgi:endonuclease/exonuclease/phosphatase family metal-dependent hydrolase
VQTRSAAVVSVTTLANPKPLFHAARRMAAALKVMTWNVQQLPVGAGGPGNPKTRARQQAKAILDLPARDRPDVIAFNEVFHGDARDTLRSKLKSPTTYPHVHDKFGGNLIKQDSGLMLFSKHPFKTLFNGKTAYFDKFKNGADWDQVAEKGIAIVRIDGPNGPVQIAFTHTQSKSEYASIRAKQFKQVCNAVKRVSNYSDPTLMANTILVGDLNVNGRVNVASGEIVDVFKNMPDRLGSLFHETWAMSSAPPGTTHVHDPGFTHQKNATGTSLNRLDYACTPRATGGATAVCIQHNWIPFRPPYSLSDHWPVMALVHAQAPNCSPAQGIELSALPPTATVGSAKTWVMPVPIQQPGMYVWAYASNPGQYAIFTNADAEGAMYERGNLSRSLVGSPVSVADMPAALQPSLAGFASGQHFTCTEPAFLRMRGSDATVPGTPTIAIVQLS